jgi:hypothetical protein
VDVAKMKQLDAKVTQVLCVFEQVFGAIAEIVRVSSNVLRGLAVVAAYLMPQIVSGTWRQEQRYSRSNSQTCYQDSDVSCPFPILREAICFAHSFLLNLRTRTYTWGFRLAVRLRDDNCQLLQVIA